MSSDCAGLIAKAFADVCAPRTVSLTPDLITLDHPKRYLELVYLPLPVSIPALGMKVN